MRITKLLLLNEIQIIIAISNAETIFWSSSASKHCYAVHQPTTIISNNKNIKTSMCNYIFYIAMYIETFLVVDFSLIHYFTAC